MSAMQSCDFRGELRAGELLCTGDRGVQVTQLSGAVKGRRKIRECWAVGTNSRMLQPALTHSLICCTRGRDQITFSHSQAFPSSLLALKLLIGRQIVVLRCSLLGAIEPEPPASLSPPATQDTVSGTRENEVTTRPDLGAAELEAGLCLHVP